MALQNSPTTVLPSFTELLTTIPIYRNSNTPIEKRSNEPDLFPSYSNPHSHATSPSQCNPIEHTIPIRQQCQIVNQVPINKSHNTQYAPYPVTYPCAAQQNNSPQSYIPQQYIMQSIPIQYQYLNESGHYVAENSRHISTPSPLVRILSTNLVFDTSRSSISSASSENSFVSSNIEAIRPGSPEPRKKNICKICCRVFTTSGHLARHNRIHTGERKHICPWPLCETRFARQDNCMQHYKTHTNGKSKKKRSP